MRSPLGLHIWTRAELRPPSTEGAVAELRQSLTVNDQINLSTMGTAEIELRLVAVGAGIRRALMALERR